MSSLDELLAERAKQGSGGFDLDAALAAKAQGVGASVQPAVRPQDIKAPQVAPSYWDLIKNSAVKGVAGLVDAIPNGLTNVANLGMVGRGLVTGEDMTGNLLPPDSLSFASKAAEKYGLTDQKHEPQGVGQRLVDMGTQAITGGGVNPAAIGRAAAAGMIKPIVRDLASAAASGVGASAGQQFAEKADTGSQAGNTTLQAIASLLGGGIAGAPIAARGTGGDRARAAMKDYTPEQLAQAHNDVKTASRMGSPITGYDAIQGVAGDNPKMQTQQRLVLNSDVGSNLAEMMRNRPQANNKIMAAATDQISPAMADPSTLGGTIQQAANDSIQAARNAGNAQAKPFYEATSNNPNLKIPASDWNTITSNRDVAHALNEVKSQPFMGITDPSHGSVQWLDSAKKYLDSKSSALAQSGDRFQSGNAADAAKAIRTTIDNSFPDYAKARSIVEQNLTNVVNPMERGQVGQLSGNMETPKNLRMQMGALLPENPIDVTPATIKNTSSLLSAQNPDIMKAALAQYLRATFNESNQATSAGGNQRGGANFAAKVSGNPGQAENLAAILQSSGANPQSFNDALTVFRAQGKSPIQGSQTAANMAEGSAMGGSGLIGLLAHPMQAAGKVAASWQNSSATKDLARALMGDNSIPQLQDLARVNGAHSPTQQQMLINLLLANAAQRQGAAQQ